MQNTFNHFQEHWAKVLQNSFTQALSKTNGNLYGSDILQNDAWAQTCSTWLTSAQNFITGLSDTRLDQASMHKLQQQYMQDVSALWQEHSKVSDILEQDRRFKNQAWQQQSMSSFMAALHVLNSRYLSDMADSVQGNEEMRERIQFGIQQFTAATAPSNFLSTNIEAQQKIIATKGESIARGVQNLFQDLQKGYISMTDESQFEVGHNVGTSEGKVVFENELFQLIEYKPLTDKVHQRPFLMVPACINKFYILDLRPDNSVVRFALEEGHHTFIISWRNPSDSMAHTTWDDYVENGVICALQTIRDITGAKDINTLGFCVGGTILATAMAVLAARKETLIHSATLLTCLVDFSNTGVLGLFIDENFVRMREQQFAQGGILSARDLSTTFNFLRPNELVWNYMVDNYLKGDTPPPFDLLYWNCDSTNMPGRMYTWYLRNTYLDNQLMRPNAATVCGEKIDFRTVKQPVYLYGSRDDHIVPIEGAYASTQIFSGKKRFVMGASGHIAGVINPLKRNKRSYWTNDELPPSYNQWLEGTTEHAGSWWGDWRQWLKTQGGRMVAAPKQYGNSTFKPIEDAPGRYVREKANITK